MIFVWVCRQQSSAFVAKGPVLPLGPLGLSIQVPQLEISGVRETTVQCDHILSPQEARVGQATWCTGKRDSTGHAASQERHK